MPHVSRNLSRIAGVVLVLVAAGCVNDTVREDRSVNFSTDGAGVGFQHGEDGVYVATGDGDKLEKIFDAREDTIAVSSPLWSPVDRRLIFTAARPADPDGNNLAREIALWDANPEGRDFRPEAIAYTCMLRPAANGDDAPPPAVLFEAHCNHTGYVAANLAVRWHPSGERVLFVDQVGEGQHSLFEFDLATKKTRRILDQSAAALIFDFTPGGSNLVCVLADDEPDPEVDGIWIRAAEKNEWWKVPQSENLAQTDSQALLERLRSTRPAWTADDQRFAFVIHVADAGSEIPIDDNPNADDVDSEDAGGDDADEDDAGADTANTDDLHAVLCVDAATREVIRLFEGPGRIRDLQWHPDSGELGFVQEGESGTLRIVDAAGTVSAVDTAAGVRRFAGWNHDGTRLLYITPEPAADANEHWAFLFPPVRDARDFVYVADTAGDEPGRVVHSGVRITFPRWSPTDDTLSLWGTYTPTHRSWLSTNVPWSLRPGDPAAILDCRTGQMTWMAVNAHEEAQVGHYYLLKRDYERAWQWYEKSAAHRPPGGPIKIAEMDQFLRQLRIHQDSNFFEYYCLTKLERHEEAAQRLGEFRRRMSFDTSDTGDMLAFLDAEEDELQAELQLVSAFVTPLIQSAYITEVYLSLDAAEDGLAFFRNGLKAATTDPEQFACAVCLSQLMLVTGDHAAYAQFARETLAPLVIEMYQPDGIDLLDDARSLSHMRQGFEQASLMIFGGLALLPMMSNDFVSRFDEGQLQGLRAGWEALRERAEDNEERTAIDLVLLAVQTQLGADDEHAAVAQPFLINAPGDEFPLNGPEDVDKLIELIRSFSR